jgi:putative restriction endonuclease
VTAALSAILVSRLEKAATDNGFDRDFGRVGEWLAFGSTHAPLQIWLGSFGDSLLIVAFSQLGVHNALDSYGVTAVSPVPPRAAGARTVNDVAALHRMLRRAFQLSKALPEEPLRQFERASATLPRATEAERVVVQRVGQDIFRAALLEYWDCRCAVTGLAVPSLLRASHIKPWASCDTDAERLDVYNGLLLAPHLDAAFDAGLITVTDEGQVMVSARLDDAALRVLGLREPLKIAKLTDGHRQYLSWHRDASSRRHRERRTER